MSFKEKFLLGFLAVLLIVSLIFIPKWQLSYHNNTLPKNSKDYIELEDKLRTTLILVWGGLIVVLGLYLTYRRIKATEKQADVIADGQITEQFTKAIDHLGAVDKEGNKNLGIRLGGIYALERISRHSKKDHRTIMDILSAYVRKNAPYDRERDISYEEGDIPNLHDDIQAILFVIGRRKLSHEEGPFEINLSQTDLGKANLHGANLWKANLHKANLGEADLQKAYLWETNLKEAFLGKANLQEATLGEADLQKAILWEANLQEAFLGGANLQKTNLGGANLKEAFLGKANLQEATLGGTNLQKAILGGTNLQKAFMLSVEQLCTVKILYKADLNPEVEEKIKEKCPHLLEEPNY
ncbi:MAG: pentapeptide repeat-containing protein [Anaerolineales bacterium]|nr:pentapeptide repeat-containing protein [Anaerolineales bacterium]